MTIPPALRILAANLVRGVLPYPDVRRRYRVRASARHLVTCSPWPGNDATPLELAQLSLLRALWLQREVHRAIGWRQREASALLARTAVENCIVGLYCLHADRPMAELRGQNAENLRSLFAYLVDAELINEAIVEILVEEVAGPEPGDLPSVYKMANKVSTAANDQLAREMYRRLYAPLSTFFTHANGIALLRHIRRGGLPKVRPSYPWVRRSPARVADGCVGILAHFVANRAGAPSDVFRQYAAAHMGRSLAPLPIVAGRGMRGAVKWGSVPAAFQEVRAGFRYFQQVPDSATWDERAEWIRRAIAAFTSVVDTDISADTSARVIEEWLVFLLGPRPEKEAGC